MYKPLTEAVYASGYLRPADEYHVFSLAEGILQRKHVREGDSVVVGQLLFEVENEEQSLRLRTAEQNLALAKQYAAANSPVLDELKAQLLSARIRYGNDSLNYVRNKRLMEQNSISDVEYRRYEQAYLVSRSEVNAAIERLERTQKQLQTDYLNAEANYRLTLRQNANFKIRAVESGRVYEINKEEGEAIKKNEGIALIGRGNRVVLKLEVDENDIRLVKVGQEVLVKVEAAGQKLIRASVTRVYPLLNSRNQTFAVDAEFVGQQPLAGLAGFSVEANIIVRQIPKTLTLPRTCLVGRDSVRVMLDGKPRTVHVEVGASDFNAIEVLSGVNPASEVIVP